MRVVARDTDVVARLRSWLGSGLAPPPRTREPAMTPGRRERRERKITWRLARLAGARVQSEGKGWEYPLAVSLEGFRADVRYEAAGAPLGRWSTTALCRSAELSCSQFATGWNVVNYRFGKTIHSMERNHMDLRCTCWDIEFSATTVFS